MDLNTINTTISKTFYKNDMILLGSYDENTVGVTLDGFVMWFIPEPKFLFDKGKLLQNRDEIDINRYVKTNGYKEAVRSNILVAFNKKTLTSFKNDDTEVYVDTKLLKVFDPKLSTFKIKNNVSGVLVYEGDTLVGIVMPTRYNENNK